MDSAIVKLNVIEVDTGDYSTPYNLLCYSPSLKRTNAGVLAGSWLRRYDHCKYGGWWCSGIDPLTWDRMQWGGFKPNRPRVDCQNNHKITKYEHPPKTESRSWLLEVPKQVWQTVAKRYGMAIAPEDREHSGGFWHWVWRENLPIVIVEGAKKAGCLLTLGYAAIALPGIWNGRRAEREREGKLLREFLIPDLQLFATTGREVYFCFDNDPKPKTRKHVDRAINATGTLFAKEGCRVNVIQLPRGKGKGVDDFVVAGGDFHSLYQTALSLENFHALNLWQLTYNTINLDRRWVTDLEIPDTGLICIKSPPGTGKTELFVKLVEKQMQVGTKTLVATHRIQLGKAIVGRIGLDWIEDKLKREYFGVFGYGLCVDSLHPHSQARFNPECWQEATFIIDEAEQVIDHLLNSSTCYSNRVAILETLRQLLGVIARSGGRIILADADLSDVSVNYIRDLIRLETGIDWQPYTVVNEWRDDSTAYDCLVFDDRNPLILEHQLDKSIAAGKRVLIHTDSRKKCKALEKGFQRRFPACKILRIDGETVADPSHPAYGCADRLNQMLEACDVAIVSPTIGTGVSIDLRGHFQAVFGIFNGVVSVAEARQALIRLREPVPRFVWAKSFGISKVGNGSVGDRQLVKASRKEAAIVLDLLQSDLNLYGVTETASLRTWAQMGARFNAERLRYGELLRQKLADDGHRVAIFDGETDKEIVAAKRQELKQVKQDIEREEAEAIATSEDIDYSEYRQLREKRQKTREERLRERKYAIAQKYRVPVTPDLVLKDNTPSWYPQILLHYLMLNPILARNRDRAHIEGHLDRGGGSLCLQDLWLVTAKTEVMLRLDVMRWFDPDLVLSGDLRELSDWTDGVKCCRQEIKDILGVTIRPDDSPIRVLAILLGQVGIKLEKLGLRRVEGRRVRCYGFPQKIDDGRREVFEAWGME